MQLLVLVKQFVRYPSRHRVAHVQGAVGTQVDAVASAGAVVVGGGTGALEVHLPGLGGLDVEEGVLSKGGVG